MNIIFGLGNPGKEYEHTRHNVGFMVINELCRKFSVKLKKKNNLQATLGEFYIDDKKVLLVEPQTYMNQSGWTVSAITDYYKVSLTNIIVIYDDIDISFGELRIRDKGSAGTHNGMRSIIDYLSDNNFIRIRIGIGKPRFELKSFVLGKFDMEEQIQLKEIINRVANACICIITEGIQKAQERYQKLINK